MRYGFGVDLGGTTVKLAFFQEDGSLVSKWEIPTNTTDNGAQILPDIAAAIQGYMAENNIPADDIIGVGIGVPGPVNSKGVVNKCVNLGWGVFNIEAELSSLTGLPVKAGNDANVAALGECWQGGGKGYENLLFVTLGTGVGGGFVLNGKLYAGGGMVGEVGHMVIEKGGVSCNCGRCGCWETYSSATGLIRMTKEAMEAHPESLLHKLAAENGDAEAARNLQQMQAIRKAQEHNSRLSKQSESTNKQL